MSGPSRLRRARVSKARNQRRPLVQDTLEKRSKLLVRALSVLAPVGLKVVGVWSVLTSIALSVVGTLLFFGLSYLLYQAVTSSAIEVAPISVPKDLADTGYTSEAVTLQLREALLNLVKEARTEKRTANVISQKDEPTIDLPQTGISLDMVATEIRNRFGFGNTWKISGSIESIDGRLRLNINLDGATEFKQFNLSLGSDQVDDLFSKAAENIFTVIDPYIVAASYTGNDPTKSITLAKDIILSYPKSNVNVAWAHILIGFIQNEKRDLPEAEKEAREAIAINNKIAVAHNNLGRTLFDYHSNNTVNEAFEEFREAIWINKNFAVPHYNLGLLLARQGERRMAMEEYNKAIQIDPKRLLCT